MFEQDLPGDNSAGFNKAGVASSLPLETCLTMNGSWGYNARDKNFKSPEELIRALVGAAGRGANLLLNVGPKPDGSIGQEAVDRLLAVGKWTEKYGKTIYGTRRGPIAPQPWGVTTVKRLRAGFHLSPRPRESRQDQVAQGSELVRPLRVRQGHPTEARAGPGWHGTGLARGRSGAGR